MGVLHGGAKGGEETIDLSEGPFRKNGSLLVHLFGSLESCLRRGGDLANQLDATIPRQPDRQPIGRHPYSFRTCL